MTRLLTCLFCFFSCLCLSAAELAPQRDKIEAVLAGQVQEARVSWWGFHPEDSTRIFQAALDSKVPKLIVDAMPTPWVTEQLYVLDNQELAFEKGAVLQAKRGCFRGTGDSLVNILSKKNVTISGEDATLQMWVEDYRSGDYKRGEWRHGINIISSENVTIAGLTIRDTGGDAIYIGDKDNRTPCKNIHITNVICDNNHRQGISVISVEGLLIEKTIMKNTRGTAPAAGLDFEPNIASESLVDCVVRDCIVENNEGCGYTFYFDHMDHTSKPISIRFENCIAINEKSYGVSLTTSNGRGGKEKEDVREKMGVQGRIEFINCRFENTGRHGIYIISKGYDGIDLVFQNHQLINCGKQEGTYPIEIATRPEDASLIGNITFDNIKITDSKDRRIINFKDYSWLEQDLRDITGTVELTRDGKTVPIKIDDAWMQDVLKNKTK